MQIYYKYPNNKNILAKKRDALRHLGYQQIKLNNSFQEESEGEL